MDGSVHQGGRKGAVMRTRGWTDSLVVAAAMTVLVTPSAADASPSWQAAEPELLTQGLEGAFGSTVGPDGALYVTETVAGRISRGDPDTGDRTTVASCLPKRMAPVGGATYVAFLDGEMYALVTRVGEEEGGSDV